MKKNNTNGKAFQTKLSLEQLKVEVLENKRTAAEIMGKYQVKSYTLRDKLFQAAQTASSKKEALEFIMDIPSEIDNKVSRKKSITIPSSLCDNFGIAVGSKYEVNLDNKKIVLTPVK